MPYIRPMVRARLAELPDATNAGELNFMFTQLCVRYIEANGLNYQRLNDVVGALEGCKAEFVRRVVNPYEDSKIAENGDVYPVQLLGAKK